MCTDNYGTDARFHATRAGADLYIRLSAFADSQRKRALGRMTDPENPDGPSYHLEFDPPPESDPALAARLVPVQDMTTVDALFMERLLAYHHESLALDVWFDKFDNVVTIEADGTVDEVTQVRVAGVAVSGCEWVCSHVHMHTKVHCKYVSRNTEG
jgi:hypothetical protein